MGNILIVDDNIQLTDTLEEYLKKEGFFVYAAQNALEAIELLDRYKIDLIIMDIMMPEKDGITATLEIRECYNIPIILLSAKAEEIDKVTGLNSGADDYITKPFSKDELIARVNAQLRRYKKLNIEPDNNTEIYIKDLYINYNCKIIKIGAKAISLTPIELDILYYLARNKGKVMSVKNIYETVWKQEFLNAETTVMFHISRLRRKIEINPKRPIYIKVVWGEGYMVD